MNIHRISRLALAGAVLTSTVVALPSSASASAPLRLRSHQTHFEQHGGVVRFRDKVTDRKSGAVVGHNRVRCTGAKSDTLHCKATYVLRKGTIKVTAAITHASHNTGRVTGGTGAYADASGTIAFDHGPKGDSLDTIRLG